jgi:hypothetical protein
LFQCLALCVTPAQLRAHFGFKLVRNGYSRPTVVAEAPPIRNL